MFMTLTESQSQSAIIVNLDHVTAIQQEEFGTKIWFSENFSFIVAESQEHIYNRIYKTSLHLNDKNLTLL